ncbi:cytochrome P450 [Linderina pennispora]|uniref:Cytochrome P450 n=1 Tax=Linderina pennispora TaxID=61395 RepID=A0A1Y1W5A7_9FUNG|nr:cytochrome P450 [Linderina pennispora]ORX68578.1 cytochrome P450 [Linderina pennispora]
MILEILSFATLLALPAILLAIVVYAALTVKRAFFSPLSTIPGPFLNKLSNLPLRYHTMTGSYHSYTTQLHAKYGEVVRVGTDFVSLSSTSDTRLVLATHAFRKGPSYTIGMMLAENSFSTTNPELNKVRRRQIGDAFAVHTMRAVEDLVVDAGANSLIKVWDAALAEQGDKARINYFYSFHRAGFDVIGALGFGQSFNILQTGNTEVIDNMQNAIHLKVLTSMIPFSRFVPALFKEEKQSQNATVQLIRDTIDMRKKLISETGKPPQIDVLQKFIDAKDPVTGEMLADKSLMSEIFLMLVAGTDTTSNTLSWVMMQLMHHPYVYQRVTEEVRTTFPDTSQTISFSEAKSKLPYLSAVIHETMRINPSVAGFLPRCAPAEGATIQGHYIPADAQICVSTAACQRNPRTWKNPETFDPERFLGQDSAERLKDLLTFSSGVRVCIGRNLAWLELYTVLANVLRRYDFELPEDAPYGAHKLSNLGIPVEIPSESFIVTSPVNPKVNCWVNVSLAKV